MKKGYEIYETKNRNNQTYKLIAWMDENVQMHVDEDRPYFTVSREDCRRVAIEIFGDIKSLSIRMSAAMRAYREMNEMTKAQLRWAN